MKKVLIFCICGIFTIGAAETYVWAATTPSAGNRCTQNGYDLANRETTSVDNCESVGLYNARRCMAYCNNGTLIFGVETCLEDYYKLGIYENISPTLYKQCVDLKKACLSLEARATGADWDESYRKCICNGGYEWSHTELKCVPSIYKTKCENDRNAHWDITYGCVCNDTLHKYWDYDANECKTLPSEQECNNWKSHMTGSNESQVKWNIGNSTCECIKNAEGNAITKPDDYYVNNAYRCVKKPHVLWREEVEKNKPKAVEKQGEIDTIIGELDGLSKDMGKSHWKNASGGFNTARLASDSVAGVVLGTVGGVITSNVIKKNQVKGGFEDLNCTVGGQRVAGFADEFNVGIQ